jgi:predicted 2-oxoglutarate/Fe(II)-dependent dioxygenase YbiX
MALKEYIKIYDNILPIETVASLTSFVSKVDFYKATIGSNKVENEQIRKVWNSGLTNTGKNMTSIKWSNFLRHVFQSYVQKYIIDTVSMNAHEISPGRVLELDILKYDTGGHYVYHVDFFHQFPRQFSLILLLNNDYEGGDLIFNNTKYNDEYKIKTQPGRLIVWPSNFLFPHKVEEVTKGKRYSIVGWSH